MLEIYALECAIEEAMDRCRVPGLALCIVKGQEVIYARGFGVTGVEDSQLAVTHNTLFRIGSMTKMLTTAALMRLVEAGTLDLDCPIKAYIPWFRLRTPGAAEQVTLRMLLTHTAGLPERTLMRQGHRELEGLDREMREDLPRYPLVAAPGTLWSYSTLGFNLAGYIAQVATQTPFPELIQSLVIEPLQMRRTTFDPTIAMTFPYAHLVGENPDGSLFVYHDGGDNTATYPGAFAFSTVLDLANLAMVHMQNGRFQGNQFLPPALLAEIQSRHAHLHVDTGLTYGLGMYIEPSYKGLRRIGHEGTLPGCAGKLIMAPEPGVAVIVLYNRENLGGPFYPACDQIIDTIFDHMLDLPVQHPQPPVIEPEPSLWPQFIGSYSRAFAMSSVNVVVEQNQLVLQAGEQKLPLEPLSHQLYIGRPDQHNGISWCPRIPYKSSSNISIGFLPTDGQAVSYLSINANVYKRKAG